jgi:prepilin-type N-terminal cleavage/methylation domain-containing protein
MRHGFTLLELIAAISIVGILAILIAPEFQKWTAAAGQARCMGNMRSIHAALGSYLNDNGQVWPQGPSPLDGDLWAAFWLECLEGQGIGRSAWQCPSLRQKTAANARADGGITETDLHYIPTMFDATPGIANRWPTQPWLIERANSHGYGALICFTDGSIKPFYKILAEQGLR